MPSHDSIEGSKASSSSLSYYIPGITAPPRCLADDMDELRAMSTSSSSITMNVTTPTSVASQRPTVSCCLSPESAKGTYRRHVVVMPRSVHLGDDLLSPSASSASYGLRNTPTMVSPYSPSHDDDDDENDNDDVKMNTDSSPSQQQAQQQKHQQQQSRQRRRRNEPTLTSFFRMEALRRSIEMEQQRVQQLQQEWDYYLGDDVANNNRVPMEIVVNENDENDDDNDPLATPPPLPPLVFRLEEPNFY